MRNRVPTLRKEGLVSERSPLIMKARDGTLVEVSEWKSEEAIRDAHQNPNVLAMWKTFFALCECVPLQSVRSVGDVRRFRAGELTRAMRLVVDPGAVRFSPM